MTRAPAPAGYECLAEVLDCALMQAASGKGAERHAQGQPFDSQPMAKITAMVGLGFPLGQIQKKAQEAGGMAARGQMDAARRELLGVINYAAGAVLAINGAAEARSATERPATAPQAPSAAQDTRQPVPGVWALNSYTALHESLIGSTGDTQDGALFPSGWTPEMEDEHLNQLADERASGPFVPVSLDDLTTEG